MTRRLARLATGLTGAALTVLLLVGPPWLLTTLVGPPVPSSWPDLDSLRSIATVGVTDTFVVTTLAVIVWIAWAQLAIAIVIEMAAAIRRRPAIRIPLVPGARPLAARLVAATLLLVTVLQPRPIATAAPFEVPVATAPTDVLDVQPAAAPEPTAAARAAVQTATRTIAVGERDSWWSLTETHLGEGIRWRELRDLNLNRTQQDGTVVRASTDQLRPGWTLVVPATDSDDHLASVADTPTDQADDTSPVADMQWEVEQGDHFWHIAKTTLEHTWDRTPDDHEIVPYWQQLIDTNRNQLAPPGNPDLIYPGQEFALPTPPFDPALAAGSGGDQNPEPVIELEELAPTSLSESRTQPQRADAETPPVDGDSQVLLEHRDLTGSHDLQDSSESPRSRIETIPEVSQDPDLGLQGANQADAADSLPGSSTAPATGWEHVVTSHQGSELPAAEVRENGERLNLDMWSSLVAGVAAAGLAGAGITRLVRRSRRLALQQRPLGTRLPTPAPDTLDHLHRLEVASPDEDTTLAGMSDLLTTIPASARPAIVTLTDDGTVRLLFPDDTAPGQPEAPWRDAGSDDAEPTGWAAQLGDSGPRRSIGLPLLVTLGRVENQTILANLGSVPSLAVCGPSAAVTTFLQAITLEVATSRIAGPLSVAVTGAGTHPALDQAHTTDDPAGALDRARIERDQHIIDDDRSVLLLVAHPRMTLPDIEDVTGDPFVGVLHAADIPPTGGWAITIHDHATSILHLPDGGLVTLQRPDLDPDAVLGELDRHDQHIPDPEAITAVDPDPDSDTTEQWDDLGRPGGQPPAATVIDVTGSTPGEGPLPAASVNGHPRSEPAAAAPSLQVRILGPVDVHRDGEPLTGLAPLTLQILIYLAIHRDGVTPERLDDVIWNGQLAPPNSQRLRSALTKLRDTLGPGPDGDPFLPRRRHRTDPVRLAGPVTTDLDLALGHLEQAHAVHGTDRLAQLDQALTHVRGEPFAGWPLSWVSEIAERAIAQLQDAAAAAAAGHRRRGEYEAAEHAIRTGLKLCDPNETLYLEWARLEAARGRHDQIGRILQRLQAAYDTHTDETAGFVGTITTATATAFQELQADAFK